MVLYLCMLALFALTGVSALEKLPSLTEYCQIEGVIVEKGGLTTTFRMDRGHFSESARTVEIPDIDFGNISSLEDSSASIPSIIYTTRRIYHADTKTMYTWSSENKTECSVETYTSNTPVPRYVEIYNNVNGFLSYYTKSTTSVGSASFDLYTMTNPIDGTSRYVIINPYTGLPYSITELKMSLENITDMEIIYTAMFTFSFPETVDPKAYVVNETNDCWDSTVPAPKTYPSEGSCTKYEPPQESSDPEAYALPPLPDYCTYTMEASGTYKANVLGQKIENSLYMDVVTQDGNCWNKLETTSTNGTVTVQGIYHYGNRSYYSWTNQVTSLTDSCTVSNNASISSANPIAEYYNKAMDFFGRSFSLSEEMYKGEAVDVYTRDDNLIRISKDHGFPLYIKYAIDYTVLSFRVGVEILFEDIKVSMDESEPRSFDVPVVEGCSAWNKVIPPPAVTDPSDLECQPYNPQEPTSSLSGGESNSEDGGFAVKPSIFALLFIIALFFTL